MAASRATWKKKPFVLPGAVPEFVEDPLTKVWVKVVPGGPGMVIVCPVVDPE
jgi:hypothetical protein